MPELRWILIVFGLALLIGIYVWGRRTSKSGAAEDDAMLRVRPGPEPAAPFDPAVDEHYPCQDGIDDSFVESQPEPESPFVAPRVARIDDSPEPTIEVMRVRDPRPARIEPTLIDDVQTAELPVREPEAELRARGSISGGASAPQAPTLSMSNSPPPPPRRTDRRKILALRLTAGAHRLPGAELQAAFEAETLQHGKYDVFHRLDEQGAAVFSVASMVEPGSFQLDKMAAESYPGITLFTQLPGPVAGMLAFNELLACGRRLHATLGGTLQDERGVPLTVHRIERIRQEIRDFEHRPAAESAHRASPTYSS